MVDNKLVGDKVHEFQELLRKVERSGTKFSEDFKVSSLIDKLPPSWNEFSKTLRHKQGELTLAQTINSIRVEEKHRVGTKTQSERPPRVNLVKDNNNKNRFNNNNRFFNNRNNPHSKGRTLKINRFTNRHNQNRTQNQTSNNNSQKGLEKKNKFCYV